MSKKNDYNETKTLILKYLSQVRFDTGSTMAEKLNLSLGAVDMCLRRLRSRGLVSRPKGIYPLRYSITTGGLARLQYYERLDVNR